MNTLSRKVIAILIVFFSIFIFVSIYQSTSKRTIDNKLIDERPQLPNVENHKKTSDDMPNNAKNNGFYKMSSDDRKIGYNQNDDHNIFENDEPKSTGERNNVSALNEAFI